MPSPSPNILLVVLDSVRADRVSCTGAGPDVTPHLAALASEGVCFSRATAESTWTLPTALSLLTGLTPREHQGEIARRLSPDVPTLAELLREAGYQTFSATNNLWVTARSGLDRGFDSRRFPPQDRRMAASMVVNVLQPLGVMRSAGDKLVGSFRRWLRHADEPWFALLWLNDAHHPYVCPREFLQRFQTRPLSRSRLLSLAQRMRRPRNFAVTATAEDLQDVQALCTGATAYVDSLVGELMATLAHRCVAEETLLVVVSDHGDMLGEHGLVGHGAPSGVYQPLIHVPLIVRGPGFTGGGVCPALVQHTDVTQTLAAAAGVADRLPATAGERPDLLAALRGQGREAAICEREKLGARSLARNREDAPGFDFDRFDCHMAAVIADDWKLIACDNGHSELYHLRDDPDEAHDVLSAHPEQAAALRTRLDAFRTRCHPHAAPDDLSAEDEVILDRRLEDLGYL